MKEKFPVYYDGKTRPLRLLKECVRCVGNAAVFFVGVVAFVAVVTSGIVLIIWTVINVGNFWVKILP
jgi:hypothetical protein